MTEPMVTPEALKAAVRELLIAEPELFADVLRNVLKESSLQREEAQYIDEKELEGIVEEDFTKFEEVFRALA